jgi:hypothetical protein
MLWIGIKRDRLASLGILLKDHQPATGNFGTIDALWVPAEGLRLALMPN